MILSLCNEQLCQGSVHTYSCLQDPHAHDDFTSSELVKYLEACGMDLEPLPLYCPPCYDTLEAVNPKLPEPTPMQEEQKSFETAAVHGPSSYDVICSRAKQFYQLPGCQRFRHIVRAAIPAYMQASTRLDKSGVIAKTIDMVIHHPNLGRIRFWKCDHSTETWNTLNSDQICDKVGHALREMIQERNRTQRKKIHSIRQVAARAS